MENHYDVLETAEVCADSKSQMADRDLQDLIDGYGEQAIVAALARSRIAGLLEKLHGGDQLRAVVWVLAEIIGSDRPRLTAECIALATGMLDDSNTTMTEVARRHGMTRANVSRRVLKLSDKLSMSPSTKMKTKRHRELYRLTNGAQKKKETK